MVRTTHNLPPISQMFWDLSDYLTLSILGEIWLGLETLHKLTSAGSYSLHILMKDFDQKTYVAVYDQFEVIMILRGWWWW